MTRSGPAKLPAVLQIDGRRYGVDTLPEDLKRLVLELQQAEAVVLKRRQMVQVMRAARDDLQRRLRESLAQQHPVDAQQPAPAVVAQPDPPAAEITPNPPQVREQEQKPSVVRRAKDKMKGLLRRLSGGAG